MKILLTNKTTPVITHEVVTINDVEHFKIPIVMMVHGIHHGSEGAIYHSGDVLNNSVPKWEGKPIVIHHPQVNGQYVSATHQGVEIVGQMTGVTFNNNALTGYGLIPVEPLKTNHVEVYNAIVNNLPMEVSTGIYSTTIEESGEYNGITYELHSTNHEPDHLALLPGEVGACSWNKGCGVRNFQTNTKNNMKKELSFIANNLQVNETDFMKIQDAVRASLDRMDSEGYYHYLRALYPDSLVYTVRGRGVSQETTYKRSYTMNEDGTVVLGDDITKVMVSVEYLPIQANTEKENKSKNQKKETMKKQEKISALITNSRTRFTEDDRETLNGLDESFLDSLEPMIERKPIEVNADAVTSFIGRLPQEEVIQLLPNELQTLINNSLAEKTAKREQMITNILGQPQSPWKREDLLQLNCEMLNKINSTITQNADFSLNVNNHGGNQNAADDDLLMPTTI